MIRIFILPLLLSLSAMATAGSIRGVVKDASTLQPIKDMNISVDVLLPDSTHIPDTTDAAGSYLIGQIAPANQIYVLEGYASGYTPLYVRIPELGSLDITYDVFLLPVSSLPPGGGDSTYVSGIVQTLGSVGSTLSPVASASVTLSSGGKETTTTTDGAGKYGTKVHLGSYTVSASAPGYQSTMSTVIGIDANGATVNAVLQANPTGVPNADPQPLPASSVLHPAYPDPFNPSTTIRFSLAQAGMVDLSVFDILGRRVETLLHDWRPAGSYTMNYAPVRASSGVYLIRLEVHDGTGSHSFAATRRTMLLK